MATSTTVLSPTTIAFIESVRLEMDRQGLLQRDLVARTGIAKGEISRLLAGKAGNFTTARMDRIAEALDTDTITLLTSWQNSQLPC